VKPDPGPDTRPPRRTLLLTLLAPSLLGVVGVHLLHSLPATFWLYLLAGCLLIPAALLRIRPLRSGPAGLSWQPRSQPRWRRAWLWLTLIFGPVFLVIYLAVRPALGSIEAYRDRVASLGLDLDQPLLLAALAFVILNPLLEEWWWRGQATPRCVAAFGPRGGIAVATAGFGLYHVVLLSGLFSLPVAVLRSLFIAAAGWLWSAIALQQRSWRDVYLAHLAADVAMVVLFALVVLPD